MPRLLLLMSLFMVSVPSFAADSAVYSQDLQDQPSSMELRKEVATPVSGSFRDSRGRLGQFTGRFEVQEFVADGSQIFARGALTGSMADSSGRDLGRIRQNVLLPIDFDSNSAGIQASCQILRLNFGAIDFDALGLQVSLSKITLDITAQQGKGNLLGNLLCAIAGLLDPRPHPHHAVVTNILNAILSVLQNSG